MEVKKKVLPIGLDDTTWDLSNNWLILAVTHDSKIDEKYEAWSFEWTMSPVTGPIPRN